MSDRRYAAIWAVPRVGLGWVWFTNGWAKLQDPAWTRSGAAPRENWERSLQAGAGTSLLDTWYRAVIQASLDAGVYAWLGGVVAVVETLAGIALILGLLTGFTALAGGLLQASVSVSGVAGMNPVMLLAVVILVLTWKTAGWLGLDRWLLPALGAPWESGLVFGRHAPAPTREVEP